mmetsp:Transcript_11284/g.16497  ORF Transcript_11284/g.16497 Transcript_11284/m.16497 type:complete len:369 (-) Transcript_11284:419-1525(-)|eukprot:CAMPEP_0194026568 /NCGR_PEP_ID=MMETSP0009_2-20130614/870_1 /TAXON_ID=210454 /ORGANISM="Grammatophora oceanica, Strain CCMP 410" /LENGTH=368 /DNA_ID=CAMNT_0038665333 /DNA_START=150 /DNA_END=1256 /DNA_ORIENTATION=+
MSTKDDSELEFPRSTASTAAANTDIVGDGESRGSKASSRRSSSSSIETAREMLSQINELRRKVGAFVNHDKVQIFVISLISINGIMMGIATFDFVEDNDTVRKFFETVDDIFLYIFTVELCLQFIYHGLKLFLDGWLVFDFVIIVMSFSLASVQVIRAFRIFRALRLITRVRTLRNLVLAMFDVMPRMTAIWGLLGLIFYIFGVMFTQLFSEMEDGSYNYFTRLDNSFFSLFQIMTLDAWADLSREVIDEYKFAWLPILMFVIVSAFVVVNLIIAVLCEAISALEGEERARIMGGDLGENDSELTSNAQEMLAEELLSLKQRLDNMEEMHRQTTMAVAFLTKQLAMKKSEQTHFESMDYETSTSSFDC